MHWYVNYPESETLFTPMHNVDFSYPAHLHGCLELSFCVRGAVEVTVSGQCLTVCAGQGILIPPNTVHSYLTKETSEYYTVLFSRNLLPDFSTMFSHKRPHHYVFCLDAQLDRQLLEFYGSERTLFGGKSLLYRAAEAFLRGNRFLESDGSDDDLTMRIASYIQDNLCREVTLQDLADHLGYSYFYISKRIRQVFGVPFTTLMSQHRVARAKMLLDSGKYTISQVALASGFGSIRTFNRIFHQLTGSTPSQYLAGTAHTEVCRLGLGGINDENNG